MSLSFHPFWMMSPQKSYHSRRKEGGTGPLFIVLTPYIAHSVMDGLVVARELADSRPTGAERTQEPRQACLSMTLADM